MLVNVRNFILGMVPDLGQAFENGGKDRNYESLGGATPSDFSIPD